MADRKIEKNNSKKVVRDIFPNEKRTIRNISMADRDEEESGRIEHEEVVKRLIRRRELKEDSERPSPRVNKTKDRPVANSVLNTNKKGSGRKLISNTIATFLVIFVSVGVIAIALSLLYSKAVVTITPKTANFQVNQKVTSKKNVSLKELQYNIITATSTQTKTVNAVKGPLIQTKSKGLVALYNYNSTTPQKLLAGTRLSDSNNLVYRTTSTVIIPGMKNLSDKKNPGSISVSVIADKPGSEFNKTNSIGEVLKVIAYKGSAKYDTIYAKTKADFSGGYSGNKLTVLPKDEKEAVESLKASLKAVLEEKIKESISSEDILYPKLSSIEYVVLPVQSQKTDTSAANKTVETQINVQGVIRAVVFDADQMFKYIAQEQVERFPSNSYTIKGIKDLNVSIDNIKDFSPKKENTLILNVDGKLSMTGTFSEDSLKTELLGKKLKESNSIFAKYPSISSAYALITPFWMRSFPNSKEKIILNIKSD